MISRMEECLDRKKSELNVEKKIMRCRKREKKRKKNRLEMEREKVTGGKSL